MLPRWLDRITGSSSDDAVAGVPAPTTVDDGQPDSVEALHRHVAVLVAQVDAASGALPTEAVVVARRITDLADEALRRAAAAPTGMNIHGRVALHAVVTDYVPTSLRRHAAARDVAGADHERLEAALVDQLGTILGAVRESVDALRDDDLRAVEAQGIFLRARFTGSDL